MKYIIEFEDEYSMNEGGMKYHQCKQVPYWSVSHGIIKNLTPYTDPDRKAIEDEVWEFARKMTSTSGNEVSEMWGCATNFGEVMHNTTYQEAKAKYDAWKKQKEQIRFGNEVVDKDGQKGIATFVYNGGRLFDVLWDDGSVTEDVDAKDFSKTGRHFPELAELLKKVKENTSNDS